MSGTFGDRLRKLLDASPGPINGAWWRPALRNLADAIDADRDALQAGLDSWREAANAWYAKAVRRVEPAGLRSKIEAAVREITSIPIGDRDEYGQGRENEREAFEERLLAALSEIFGDRAVPPAEDEAAHVAGRERTQEGMQALDRMMELVKRVRAEEVPHLSGIELAEEVERYVHLVSPTSRPRRREPTDCPECGTKHPAYRFGCPLSTIGPSPRTDREEATNIYGEPVSESAAAFAERWDEDFRTAREKLADRAAEGREPGRVKGVDRG